ncbi:MAG: DUF309 domain-containing protein [Planctomycetaceae bacterium]
MTPRPLPRYTHVPGRTPHPINDPDGHSFGLAIGSPCPLDPDRPERSADYLRGIALFNAGYYWEAHEVWEELWHAAGRRGTVARFLKGLIKLAAAGVKQYEGRPVGVQRHAERAVQLLSEVARAVSPNAIYAGLPLAALTSLAAAVTVASPESWNGSPPLPGLIGVLPELVSDPKQSGRSVDRQ